MKPIILVMAAAGSLCGALLGMKLKHMDPHGVRSGPPTPKVPVLVELFTSEGCSSCPPADKLLARLQRQQPAAGALIIPLSEHVDYWDGASWRDPFSSPAFTARQGAYVRALRAQDTYTPEMVVDGQAEFVGSDEDAALNSISAAAEVRKAKVEVSVSGDNILDTRIHGIMNS